MNERSLFFAVLDVDDPAARSAFLTERCAGDAALRLRVEDLMRAHEAAGSFLKRPAAEVGTQLTVDTSAEAAPSDAPGTRLGPYRLLRPLGEGGMGTVYLAEQTEPVRRQVALKVIKPGMDTAAVIARFAAERQALALMDHPNIAKVLDAGQTPSADAGGSSRPYFVMELIPGAPIATYCDDHRLTLPERLRLFVAVCEAVQHAHMKGVLHRDIKPSNVLVAVYDGRPVPKVIDFGVAKALQQPLTDRTLVTGVGAILGTLEFLSPEQAGRNALDVDTRSDVYALGVLLYELLTGTTPLGHESLQSASFHEILRRVREEEAPAPSARLGSAPATVATARGSESAKLARQVRGDLDWIALKALEKDRNRRYDTAAALARDIERSLNDEPVSAGPPSVAYRLRKLARRHKGALAAVAACAALLIAGTAVSAWQAVRATWAERETGRQRAEATEEAAIAKAVLAFLNEDVLGQASPYNQAGPGRAPDPDLKVRTALDRAATNLSGKFADRPRVEIAVRTALGKAYREIGALDPAGFQLAQAVRLARDTLGDDHPDTLSPLRSLAQLHLDQGKYDDAEAHFTQVLEGYRRRHGEDHEDTLQARTNLAAVFQARGDLDKAEGRLAEILEDQKRVLGEENSVTLATSHNLALLHRDRGRFRDAERLLTAFIAAEGRLLGEEHPVTLRGRNNLATLYQNEGRHELALPILQTLLDVNRRTLGDEHNDTCTARNNLAVSHVELQHFDKATPLYEHNLEIQHRRLGADHPHTLGTMGNLAGLHFASGKYAEAEVLFAKVLVSCRRTPGENSLDTLQAMNNLATVYRLQKKYAKAEPLSVNALAGIRKLLGTGSPQTILCVENLAGLYHDAAKHAEAEPLFAEVLAALRQRPEGAVDARAAFILVSLGRVRLHLKKGSAAEPPLREALAIYEKITPTTWPRYDTQSRLGESLTAQAKYTDAEPLLLAGYEGMRQQTTEALAGGPDRTEAGERLARLYEAWGKPEEAAAWRSKIAAAAKER